MYVCMYVCMCVCVSVCMCVCVYVCMCVCMYVCVCMFIRMYDSIPTSFRLAGLISRPAIRPTLRYHVGRVVSVRALFRCDLSQDDGHKIRCHTDEN